MTPKILSESELEDKAGKIVELTSGGLRIKDEKTLQDSFIDELVWTVNFGKHTAQSKAGWLIRACANYLQIRPASIQGLYEAMGRREVEGFTVPAINIRTLTYETARALFKTAINLDSKAFIFEIARSEMVYTAQPPPVYSSTILAAAIKEGYTGPVFIQGDHFQISKKNFEKDHQQEIRNLKESIKTSISSGFFNIDIDGSTLVDLSKQQLKGQQALNGRVTALLTAFIRQNQPRHITISVGGEIGEVGGHNSTPEEFLAFMEEFLSNLNKSGKLKGISKISVQTGTSHGGIPLPDGSIAGTKIDFSVLKSISKIAKEKYGLSGTVQHGASTLPEELFDKFPDSGASEIHLATGFQNIFYEHPHLPDEMRQQLYDYIRKNYICEKKDNETDAQFIYRLRKKALGPFKSQIWSMNQEIKNRISKSLEEKFTIIMKKLKVEKTSDIILRYTETMEVVPGQETYDEIFSLFLPGQPTDVRGE